MLGELAGIDGTTIHKYELGSRNPKPDQLLKIANVVAKLAIKQFGSVEKYTEAMKHNLEHFSEIMDNWYAQIPEEMRTEYRFLESARHKGENVATDNVQNIVKDIIAHAYGNSSTAQLVGTESSYCRMIIELYSNDYLKTVTDTKYGTGSCDYIVESFRYYLHKSENK